MLRRRKDLGTQLFHYFSVEGYIPEDYVLRRVDELIDFMAIRKRLAELYDRHFGRPAIDPEVMFRILLLGYLFGLSENQLFRELRMHLGYRWFCKLNPDDPVPDRTTLNKLRNHRWAKAGVIESFLQMVVDQCIAHGLVKARYLSVDGTQVEANASIASFELIEVSETVQEYLERLDLTGGEEKEAGNGNQGNTQGTSGDEGKVIDIGSGSWDRSSSPARRKSRRDFRGEKLSNATHRIPMRDCTERGRAKGPS